MDEFPCRVCDKPVATNHKAACCDLYFKWVYIYCNNIYKNIYQKLKKDNNPWFCKLCLRKEFSVSSLNNTKLSKLLNGQILFFIYFSTCILKEYKNILKSPSTIIINISFETGIFPEQRKIAHIRSIFKKGNKLDSLNSKAISFVSNISKIFETAMYLRLYKFLDKFKCLHKKPFGFRNFQSTNHALGNITEEKRQSLDED